MLIVAVGKSPLPTLNDSPAGCRWGVWHVSETLTLIQTNLCDFQTCTIKLLSDLSSREYKTLPFSIDIPISRTKDSKTTLLAPKKLI